MANLVNDSRATVDTLIHSCFLSPKRSQAVPYVQHAHPEPKHTRLTLNLAALRLPIYPATRILAHRLIPRVARQSRRRPAADPGLAVEDELLVLARSREAELVLELLLCDVEAVWVRGDRDVDCARDVAALLELYGFARV